MPTVSYPDGLDLNLIPVVVAIAELAAEGGTIYKAAIRERLNIKSYPTLATKLGKLEGMGLITTTHHTVELPNDPLIYIVELPKVGRVEPHHTNKHTNKRSAEEVLSKSGEEFVEESVKVIQKQMQKILDAEPDNVKAAEFKRDAQDKLLGWVNSRYNQVFTDFNARIWNVRYAVWECADAWVRGTINQKLKDKGLGDAINSYIRWACRDQAKVEQHKVQTREKRRKEISPLEEMFDAVNRRK